MSSLVLDFWVRVGRPSTVGRPVIVGLPINFQSELLDLLALRSLRLNCVTEAYSSMWTQCFVPSFATDSWASGSDRANRPHLNSSNPQWTLQSPLRFAADRRQALVEIDALVALMLGLDADELCTIYRTQFAVLHGYERANLYDVNGRLVPNAIAADYRKRGDRLSAEERTATNPAGNTYTYEFPFVTNDREIDMRQAYAHFEKILAERS